MKFLIKDTMAKACRWSSKRIEAKMEADGGSFYINRLAIHQWAYPKNFG
jgi:hypothetical protein